MQPQSTFLSHAEIEHATGLTREVLRKWELRYGFPNTVRGERGERKFFAEEVEKLQHMRRMAELGWRPGQLVTLNVAQLKKLADEQASKSASAYRADCLTDEADALLQCLAPEANWAQAHDYVEALIRDQGLQRFIDVHLPAFNEAVGSAWSAGRLSVHAEHHFTEIVKSCVNAALARLDGGLHPPRILISTPPGEAHALGVLALKAAVRLAGFKCVSLGTQTPLENMVAAARDWDVQIVALSISSHMPRASASTYVSALRQMLPAKCRLWLGGAGALNLGLQDTPGIETYVTTAAAVDTLHGESTSAANAHS
jgi:methanogenic corrinoid protein MtbC1